MNRPSRYGFEDEGLAGQSDSAPPDHPGIGQPRMPQGAQDVPLYSQQDPMAQAHSQHAAGAAQAEPAHGSWGPDATPNADDDTVDAEVVSRAPSAKRRRGPLLIFAALFGILVIAVAVTMIRALTGGSGAGAPERVAQEAAVQTPAVVPSGPSGQLPPVDPALVPGQATSALQDPAVVAAQAMQAAQAGQVPQPAQIPQMQQTPQFAQASVPAQAGTSSQLPPGGLTMAAPQSGLQSSSSAVPARSDQQAQVQALQRAIDELRKEMAALREQARRQATQAVAQRPVRPGPSGSSMVAAGGGAATAVAEAQSGQSVQAGKSRGVQRGSQRDQRDDTSSAASGPASPVATSSGQVASPAAATGDSLPGLQLRAVYPPTGADMQAWVLEGEALRVVSRGSVIGGLRVLDVFPDRVLTDRGVIR